MKTPMSNQITIDSLRLAANILDSVATDQLYNSEVEGSMMQLIKDIRSKGDNLLMVAKLLEAASQKDNTEVPF